MGQFQIVEEGMTCPWMREGLLSPFLTRKRGKVSEEKDSCGREEGVEMEKFEGGDRWHLEALTSRARRRGERRPTPNLRCGPYVRLLGNPHCGKGVRVPERQALP